MVEILGTSGGDTIRTTLAAGSLNGLPDATDEGDVIDAGDGNDLVIAGTGDDTIVSGAGTDTLDGGEGINALDFSSATQGVAMVLAQDDVFDDGFGNRETASGFTVAYGSALRDPLFAGSGGGDSLFGGGGNDDVYGNGGDDTLYGGDDDDLVVGEEGADILLGEGGRDTLIGGRTDEAVFDDGGPGLGQLADDATPDTLEGREGNDSIVLGDGDVGSGGQGDDDFAFAAYGNPLYDQPLAIGTAAFSGNLADYSVYRDGDDLFITDLVGTDGTDRLGRALLLAEQGPQLVATLQFADQAVDVLGAGFDIVINQQPVIEGARFDTDAGIPTGASVLASDPDGQPLTLIGLVRGPDNGTVTEVAFDPETSRISFLYTPDEGYFDPNTPDTFDLAISDGYQTAVQTIEVYVAFDSATTDSLVVGVGRDFAWDLGANDRDEAGDAANYFNLAYAPANATNASLDNITGILTGTAALTPGFGVGLYEAEFPTTAFNTAPIFLTVAELAESLDGTTDDDVILGYGLDDTLTGGLGDDTLDGGSGDDVAVFAGNIADYTITQSGLGVTVQGADGTDVVRRVETLRFDDATFAVTGSLDPLAGAVDGRLVNGLGGTAGFGENGIALGDTDEAGERIDLAPIFGGALNFFGEQVTTAFVNANGVLAFNQAWATSFRTPFLGGVDISAIAPFWVDMSANGASTASPGGNSQGSGRVWWDMDADNAVLTVTWDDLTFPGGTADALNAFQLQLVGRGGEGNFDIIFRYEAIAPNSGATAGFANTPDSAVYELPGSGTPATATLDTAPGNTGLPGLWRFSVTGGELAPAGGNDSYATEEDVPLVVAVADGVLGNDFDPLGRPLSALLEQAPGHGLVTLNTDGSFTYTPDANFFGTDSFTYRLGSGPLLSDPISVVITVAGENDAPFALGFDGRVSEAAPIGTEVGVLFGFDPETAAASLIYQLIDDAGGLFVLDGRTVRLAGALDYEAAILHDLIVRVTDAEGLSFDGTARVFVNNVNEGPAFVTFTPESGTFPPQIRENLPAGTKVGEVSATDTEGDPITFTVSGGGVELRNGNEIYTTRPFDHETEGSFSFSVRAAEPSGDGVTGFFTVEVTNLNERPIAVDDLRETLAGQPVTIAVLLNDRDPDDSAGGLDPLEIVEFTQPLNGFVTLDGGVFTYTPDAGFSGSESFTYRVADEGGLLSNEATVTITVRPYVLEGGADEFEVEEDDFLVTLDVLGNDRVLDADGNPLPDVPLFVADITAPNNGGGASIAADGKSIVYSPRENNDSVEQFSYRLTDRNGNVSDLIRVLVNLSPVQDDPFQAAPISFVDVANDRPYNGTVAELEPVYIRDADFFDEIRVIAGSGTSEQGGTVSWTGISDRLQFTYLAPEGFEGVDRFSFTFNDFDSTSADGSGNLLPNGGNHEGVVTLTVVGPEPIGVNDDYTIQVGQTISGNVLTNDRNPIGDGSLIALNLFEDMGSANPIDVEGNFTFTGTQSGRYIFKYVPYAGNLAGDVTILQIRVTPKPPPPDPSFPGGFPIPGGSVWGDPHFITFDGLAYDFQGWGEYVLARATEGRDFEVQIRTRPWVEGAQVTVVDSAVARIGAHVVQVGIDGTVLVNGTAASLVAGGDPLLLGGGVGLWRTSAGEYVFSHEDGEKVRFSLAPSYMDVRPVPGPERIGKLVGLLGDADGDRSDDLQLADGTSLGTTLSSTVLYGDFATAWRVTDANSLFTYPEGEGTADYQRPDFLLAKITLADLPAAVVAAAAALVDAAGITDPALREAAILDLVLTGETGFLDTAASQPDPVEAATIITPPPPPLVGLTSPLAAVTEGDDGSASITFTAFRTGDTAGALTLGWAVQAGGAGFANAADFIGGVLPQGSVTFADGADEATITLNIAGDATAELDETIRVALTGVPSGVVVASATAQGTITNDDGAIVPVVQDDTVATGFETAVTITVLANDSDPGGQPLSVTALGPAGRGSVLVNAAGQVVYTPGAGFSGTDSFTYTVTDARGGTGSATVTVTVAPDNTAPVVATPIADQSSPEDTAWSFALLAGTFSDPDGDSLTLSASLADGGALPTWLTFDAASGTFAGTPPLDFTGTLDLRVTATDTGGLSASDVFAIVVTAVNDAPRFTAPAPNVAAAPDTDLLVDLGGARATDVDGDTLSFELVRADGGALPDWIAFDPATGRLTGRPGLIDSGITAFDLVAQDPEGASATDRFVLTVGDLRLGTSGPDRLVGTVAGDAIDGLAGEDILRGGGAADVLRGGADADRLIGEDGADTLIGGEGNDVLDGGAGRDWMEGGTGDDGYFVDQVGEIIIEEEGGGIDRIISTVSISVLQPNVEQVRLVGSADIDAEGNELDNLLHGNAGQNLLLGDRGNDRLDGGANVDSMVGGAGNDVYVVDDVREVLVEDEGGGTDRVVALVDWTLGDHFEQLTLAGTADLSGIGNALGNLMTGNVGANSIFGGAGRDRLNGGRGADTLVGGADDDVMVVDDIADVVVEEPGGGIDRVVSTVDWALGDHVEQLVLTGTGNVSGTGNALDNLMLGNDGANRLDGGGGDDRVNGLAGDDALLGGGGKDLLIGGLGADTLTGGAEADIFDFRSVLEANGDVVTDFTAAQGDRLRLSAIDANAMIDGNQAFAWIGAAAFSGAAGQLRFAGGLLQGDVDGDSAADFTIALEGVTSLSRGSVWV